MREVFCIILVCVTSVLVAAGMYMVAKRDIAYQCSLTGSFYSNGQAYSCQPVRNYGGPRGG